ncbi:hypothetical protein QBC40DRAFT_271665 [Triangularia verruculosa]|uniref:Uncharacterized protein n=1 Tax=Triangularia verruculosa TaxID=2587418 RepID=A0AAN6XQM4_9PEZI|nr:hypothetical protein QBC40DRAFT_271665 [Triangularia verruculosa]
MDFLNKVTGGSSNKDETTANTATAQNPSTTNTADSSSSSSGGLMGKLNSMAGGGKESEKNEDALDKGVDLFQQHVLGQGDQSNESAIEQAKDEQISDFVRDQYKKNMGKDFPVADK